MQLRPLTLDDRSVFEAYTSQIQTLKPVGAISLLHLSSYSFAPLFVWQDHFQFFWSLRQDRFCVFAKQGEDYFMPILPFPWTVDNRSYVKLIHDVFEFMLSSNQNPQIARIENVSEELLIMLKKEGFKVIEKESEYVYRTEDIYNLRGNRYKTHRNAYNAYVSQYPSITSEPYNRRTCFDACMKLYETWQHSRAEKYQDPIYHAMLEDSLSAHRTGLTYASELGLIGRVVRIDGDIKAYTCGYPLNKQTFCVLFEITDLNIRGLSHYIFRTLCIELKNQYKWINTMGDSELENLKRVKRSYHPTKLIPSYNIYENSTYLS